MIEGNTVHKYIDRNRQFVVDPFAENNNFNSDFQDPFIAEVNDIISINEGLYRNKRALLDVSVRLELITELIRIYKRGEIDKEEFRDDVNAEIQQWVRDLSRLFYDSVISESGEASGYLQLLRALDILTDDYIDVSTFDSDSQVIKCVERMLEALKNFDINVANFGIDENDDYNTILKKIFALTFNLDEAERIIHRKSEISQKLTTEEKMLLKISRMLSEKLHQFTREYANNVLKVPVGFKTFLVLHEVRVELQKVEEEIANISDQYFMLCQKAENKGYRRTNLNRYSKKRTGY